MSVHKRVQGKRTTWRVRWRAEGTNQSRTFETRREADAFDREQRNRSQLGAHAPAEPARIPLGDWLRTWWSANAVSWAHSTRLQRSFVLDKWIVPYVARIRLRDLGTARIREWRSEITREGCPPTTANHALSILSAALGLAVTDGLLPSNPCRNIRRLTVVVERPRALAPIEVERLRVHMPTQRDVVILGLLAYAGLRPGEVFALTWGSTGRVLVIDRSITLGEVRPTKTNRRRTVELVAPLTADIERLRTAASAPNDLVCPAIRSQAIDLHNWTRRVWHPACEAAGLRAVPSDGRHTYTSLLIHEGRSAPYVAAALGHSSVTTTLTHYAHIFDEAQLGTAVAMVDAINAARVQVSAERAAAARKAAARRRDDQSSRT